MNSLRFKKFQLKHFCSLVGSNQLELEYIIDHIDSYYQEWAEIKLNGVGQPKTYKNGDIKKRILRPSIGRLKTIQSAIKNRILSNIPLPTNLHGGIKKRSNISNAKAHQGRKFKLKTDIKDFYPGISSKRVYKSLTDVGLSSHFASWITKLTTWKGALPQGTPTSTHIANIAFLKIDEKLILFCNQYDIIYTRFIDDLTFSSPQDFRAIVPQIIEIICKESFGINYRKTTYTGSKATITGIEVFNNFIDAPSKIKEKIKAEKDTQSLTKPYTAYQSHIRKLNKNITSKKIRQGRLEPNSD